MLFTGREGRMGKTCARGLEYGPKPKAEGRTQDQGHSFSHTDRPSPVNNMLIFFSCGKFVLQITNGFFYAALVIEWACEPSSNDL